MSRRDFWEQIHTISAQGTTVLVTTHYMDEAERCHRLAFIFRGELLTTGSPEQVISARGLTVADIVLTGSAQRAAAVLRAHPAVDEVAHLGHRLRVAARGEVDATELASMVLGQHQLAIEHCESVRPNVEDTFVSMVREDQREQMQASG